MLQPDDSDTSWRYAIDGDAFAFRRFVSWLRGAIIEQGSDRTVKFQPVDEYGYDDEEELDPIFIELSEWLLFGLPDTYDKYLVDWRYQNDIAVADRRLSFRAHLSASHDSEGRMEKELEDIDFWRQFLVEVVDEWFSYPWTKEEI